MGSDPAPFFANLFLFFYEAKWMKELKKKDYTKALKYGNINRFIDDLIAINDCKEFMNTFLQIYPQELKLNKENDSDQHATFLDMDITIEGRKLKTKLYDKRNSYNFDIVRFPYKNSNLPSKMFYATIGAEVLRICRATSEYTDFISTTSPFLARMRSQGAFEGAIKRALRKMISRHWESFAKYDIPDTDIIHDVIATT